MSSWPGKYTMSAWPENMLSEFSTSSDPARSSQGGEIQGNLNPGLGEKVAADPGKKKKRASVLAGYCLECFAGGVADRLRRVQLTEGRAMLPQSRAGVLTNNFLLSIIAMYCGIVRSFNSSMRE